MRFFILIILLTASLHTIASSELSFDFRKNMRHLGENEEGLLWRTGLRFPFSFSHSRSRVGVESGNYLDLAGKFKTSLHYHRAKHDWSSAFFLNEAYSMSPAIKNRFIKTTDLMRIETRYLYDLNDWLSSYAHARMETSLFNGIDIDSKENQYEFRDVHDKKIGEQKTSEVHLSDPFRPIYFQENVGLAASMLDKEYAELEAKGALSFRQTLADKQRVFVDEIDSVRIVRNLRSFYQIGPMIGTSLSGAIYNQRIEYNAGIDLMWPFFERPTEKERSFIDELNLEAGAGIAFRLSDWSSLSYEYTAVRVPDILKQFQQNHLITVDIRLDWLYKFELISSAADADKHQ